MKRNHLLRSILLTCVCLLCTSFGHPTAAQTQATEGQLLALDAKGVASKSCPLKHTDVKAEISGFIARVTVTQQFQNPFADKIEAVYTFPLPQAAAVDDMTIVIGERVVKGKIMRREEAQATYDAAKARGQTAALLNQQRPNIFTQAVANILPAQQIQVTISYVETLKYDEGSYEWHFPMVVAERYLPAADTSVQPDTNNDQADAPQPVATATPMVPDEPINPPAMPEGMRAGHDISLTVNIDAGVPLVGFKSATHEIEATQPGTGKAMVRLKEQAVIPNKDFILKYDVAGSQIEDALLFHRDNNDGYFTFILQPPERITVEDVTPKELVFVLDTSGSMGGFPIEKAKETMMLALNGMYPRDTFNVILFSGDTRILFDQPRPATPENIEEAKKILAGVRGDGGTEMMQAIRAALAPSDESDHVRITCFMTDGEVGNDMDIIAEVKKHPKARVFAMGFGYSPNRFLLDKITEYGRGEVEYVSQNGDAEKVAERFHQRVRNPLLTDVSIDWGGLPVTDIYPKKIPDLFSAKPVILSGRYTAAGRGLIRLKGMMSGREFVREIPIELPEVEAGHDVLGTLWARRKVDDLMGHDMSGLQGGKMRKELKTEITNLGLAYRMMTQFTSFVAVDEQSPVDAIVPRRVDVQVESTVGESILVNGGGVIARGSTASISGFPPGLSATVTVQAAAPMVQMDTTSVGVNIEVRQIAELPINGRSVSSLYLMTPGTVPSGENQSFGNIRFSGSTNGQRSSANQFTLDGVNANFGVATGGAVPGASAGGGAPGLTAMGDTSAITPFSAIQEVDVRTSSNLAEYGRNTGAIVNVVTKSGTNTFHGSAFEFFGNHAFDAGDWFANSRGLSKPLSGSNEFGGTLGGPIQRDRIFFFAAYEGYRLWQPVTAITDVPSLASRLSATGAGRQLLAAYPLPTGGARPDGFAESAAAFVNRGSHNSGALRLDFQQTSKLNWGGYYNFTDSLAGERGLGGYSLNTLARVFNRSQEILGRSTWTISPRLIADFRLNYNRLNSRSSYRLDDFGGAAPPPVSVSAANSVFDLNRHNTMLMSAAEADSTQRQFNAVGSVAAIAGVHQFKFGADYRRTFPIIGLREFEQDTLFDGVAQALTGVAARVNMFARTQPQRPTFDSLSIYAQDEWRKTSRLTFNYGLRWELNPAPGTRGTQLPAVNDVANPAQLSFAPAGTKLWATTYGNLAPRFGAAYQLKSDGSVVVRGGFGVYYDSSNKAVGDAFAESYPVLKATTAFAAPFPFAAAATPASPTITAPLSVFDPTLKLPLSLQWNVSVERELGPDQVISAAYVASANRRLLLTTTAVDPSAAFSLVRVTNNDGESDYHSLQLVFRRRLSKKLAAMVSYTLGKSSDNFSEDSASSALFRAVDSQLERGPSDFDIRHTLSGLVTYDPRSPFQGGVLKHLFDNWSLNSAFNVHSAAPVNVLYAVPTTYGFWYLRPDVVAGSSLYQIDPNVAGNRRINAAAFTVPGDLRQGSLGRNALRGFSLAQFDFALRRRFNFTEAVRLTVGIEAANIFNHPNFASPQGSDASLGTRFSSGAFTLNPTFGESFMHAARIGSGAVGDTFGASYYPGGPRTMRLSARLEF